MITEAIIFTILIIGLCKLSMLSISEAEPLLRTRGEKFTKNGKKSWKNFTATIIDPGGDAISGGWRTSPRQFSYAVGIHAAGAGLHCGGAIINVTHVLTAAHCVLDDSTTYYVYAGSAELDDEAFETRAVSRIQRHPLYSETERPSLVCADGRTDVLDYDIAVLKLESALPLNDRIGTVLPDVWGMDTSCLRCAVAGWGDTDEPATERYLHWMPVKVLSAEESAMYAAPISDSMFGAINLERIASTMRGDSGSALVCGNSLRNRAVIGIASLTPCNPKAPAVYASVSKSMDFIIAAIRSSL